MIISVANPIYDSVFKYIMEDERVARILLSALLKKEVVEVEVRRHEYTNGQVLRVDEDRYAGDSELQYILHRLLSAASDSKLRQDMNVEDEYFSAIEHRDTAIMHRDKRIAEQASRIAEQNELLSQKDEQLSQKDELLKQQEAQIRQQRERMEAVARKLAAAGLAPKEIAGMTGL